MDVDTLDSAASLCRLLADNTRLRLLNILEAESLSAAELTDITGLSQSRISTHLARLREAGLTEEIQAAAAAGSKQHQLSASGRVQPLWKALRSGLNDPQLAVDIEAAREVVAARDRSQTWASSVAGHMDQHYSPGRTWAATAAAFAQAVELGDVIDIASGDGVLAELLSDRAASVTCADISAAVVEAGQQRLAGAGNVRFQQADMHALPFGAASFDQAFLMHALTYSRDPQAVLREAARVLRPGGALVLATLRSHDHAATTNVFDHVNLGFDPEQIRDWLSGAGLTTESCAVALTEPRPPYFGVIVARAVKPSMDSAASRTHGNRATTHAAPSVHGE